MRQAAALTPEIARQYIWVDAFTGLLYPDDNLHHVRGVQIEADWVPDAEEQLEVWIYGQPRREADDE